MQALRQPRSTCRPSKRSGSSALTAHRSPARFPSSCRHAQNQAQMSSTSDSQQTVRFQNKQGLTLVGTLTPGATASAPAVLLCHGYAGHRNDCILPQLADALGREALASLRFDFAGNGDSEGVFRFSNYTEEVADIRAAKEYLQQMGVPVLGLVGHSKGGDDVLLYASSYDDIPAVVNLAGRLHMAEGITKRFGEDIFQQLEAGPKTITAKRNDGVSFPVQITLKDLQNRVSLDMAAAASSIRRSKVLTVHGSNDTVIPVEDGKDIAALVANSELVVVEGADHNFRSPEHSAAAVSAIVKFFKKNEELVGRT